MAQPARKARERDDDDERRGGTGTYRRARRDRGAETRARLIAAALDVFGRLGFEGATTRQIANEAGANLAAIVYHFGSKEALYRATAEYVVGQLAARVGGALGAAADDLAHIDPAAAGARLIVLMETFVDVILGEAEAEKWARFIVREQLQPTAAFDVIYDFMGRAHTIGTALVAAATGADPDATATKLKTFTIMGQGLIFRVAQSVVLRRIGASALAGAERDEIKRQIGRHISAILAAERAS
jgi:AcrR family transcriptional regulator